MMAAEPPTDLGQALHDWHAALARGDRQARLAARLLVDILVAGGLDERLEEIQSRQLHARPMPPKPARQEALLDDVLRLATQNVTISAELYRRLAVQEQRLAEIHAASQAAQALLQPSARLVQGRRQLMPSLLRLLAVIGVLLLAAAWLAVAVGKAACPQPIHSLPPPEPRSPSGTNADVL